jgi:hypothetical protein
MKKTILIAISIFISNFVFTSDSFAQCDSTNAMCEKHLRGQFISDGQQYRALLIDDENAEFHVPFYGGSTYRIAACSGGSDGNLLFSIFDKERNLLFTNAEYKNSPYWDFEFVNTIDCIIETRLDLMKNQSSGCAVMLIGFKQ